MSTVLLKGNILNFVAHIEDESLLREILEFCFSKIKQEYPPDGMPPDILAELKGAIQRSYDEENLIPHEAVKQERAQWSHEN